MELRIAGTVNDSIVDGPGIRYTIFTQGCPHHCEGCHNPHTHDFNGGKLADTDKIYRRICENPLLTGVTFSGGEPFCQPEALADLGEKIQEHGLNVFCYTGFTFEQLLEMGEKNQSIIQLLSVIDTLVDGKFELDKRSLELKFKGSSNQRIIDCKESLRLGKAIEKEI